MGYGRFYISKKTKMNPFAKFKSRPFNFVLYRALWHYYHGTKRVSRLLLSDYAKNFNADR